MLAFSLYLALFLWLIYYNGFFGIVKDAAVTKKQFAFLFLLKTLAIPCFYLIYKVTYGGIESLDAGVFYNDAKAVNNLAQHNFTDYLRLLFGLQDDSVGSSIYNNCLIYTHNWDNGKLKDYLYNDNRILIRLHSVLHFIAFNSYFVHALFSCFLSFIGIAQIYKSFKEYFVQKEFAMLLLLCLFPALWFYTGALLKEGITVFFLGCTLYQLKKIIITRLAIKDLLYLVFLLFISFLLKPYILLFSAICFSLFFILAKAPSIKYKFAVFLGVLFFILISANTLSLVFKNKSLADAALTRQRIFAAASKGGIFLLDSTKFVRLEYDSTLLQKVASKQNHFTIKKKVPYLYWEHSHQQDTLICEKNTDTLTEYQLVYQMAKSGSNFDLNLNSSNLFSIGATCLYYSLFYPLFFNAKSPLQLLASAENLLLILSFILIFLGVLQNKKNNFFALSLIFVALSICFVIGFTTPNSGAIFRYRSPVVVFILLAALYYVEPLRLKIFKKPFKI